MPVQTYKRPTYAPRINYAWQTAGPYRDFYRRIQTSLDRVQDAHGIVSVRDYHPNAGDGSLTDDAPFVQAGIDDLSAQGGGTLWLPQGRYFWQSPVFIESSDVRIIGMGPATLIAVDFDDAAIYIGDGTNKILRNGIFGLAIVKRGADQAGGDAIFIQFADEWLLQDIWVYQPTGADYNRMYRGIETFDCERGLITNCQIEDCVDTGVFIGDSVECFITDNHIHRNAGFNLEVSNSTGVVTQSTNLNGGGVTGVGYRETGTTATCILQNCDLRGNAVAISSLSASTFAEFNLGLSLNNNSGIVAGVATLGVTSVLLTITGGTAGGAAINSISPVKRAGYLLQVQLSPSNTNTMYMTDNVGNLRLAGAFRASNNTGGALTSFPTITLQSDGTNWLEVSRSDRRQTTVGSIVAAAAIAVPTTNYDNFVTITNATGANITINTINSAAGAGGFVGQRLVLKLAPTVAGSAITISDNAITATNILLNALDAIPFVVTVGANVDGLIEFQWDGTNWLELHRADGL